MIPGVKGPIPIEERATSSGPAASALKLPARSPGTRSESGPAAAPQPSITDPKVVPYILSNLPSQTLSKFGGELEGHLRQLLSAVRTAALQNNLQKRYEQEGKPMRERAEDLDHLDNRIMAIGRDVERVKSFCRKKTVVPDEAEVLSRYLAASTKFAEDLDTKYRPVITIALKHLEREAKQRKEFEELVEHLETQVLPIVKHLGRPGHGAVIGYVAFVDQERGTFGVKCGKALLTVNGVESASFDFDGKVPSFSRAENAHPIPKPGQKVVVGLVREQTDGTPLSTTGWMPYGKAVALVRERQAESRS
jgi:hypothetical protein